jgi:hypothetical protein
MLAHQLDGTPERRRRVAPDQALAVADDDCVARLQPARAVADVETDVTRRAADTLGRACEVARRRRRRAGRRARGGPGGR